MNDPNPVNPLNPVQYLELLSHSSAFTMAYFDQISPVLASGGHHSEATSGQPAGLHTQAQDG